MIFKYLPPLVQLIVIKDLIKFEQDMRQREISVKDALAVLEADELLEYDIEDGSIILE